jgi:hypothetical protein
MEIENMSIENILYDFLTNSGITISIISLVLSYLAYRISKKDHASKDANIELYQAISGSNPSYLIKPDRINNEDPDLLG